jgi:hypothetical protein
MGIFDDGSDTTESIRAGLALIRDAETAERSPPTDARPSTLDDWMDTGRALRHASPRLFTRALETIEADVVELAELAEDSEH